MSVRVMVGDCRSVLPSLAASSVDACVTSPPYWGLRDYGVAGQLGLEASFAEYVAAMVDVFREVRRVLRPEGTLWLNLGDAYASEGGPGWQGKNGQRADRRFTAVRDSVAMREASRSARDGLKAKDLIGMPWRVAFALQADGWWLRQDIIWAKPNPMPESVTDRCTKAHEYVFLMSKSARYYYDAEAIKEDGALRVSGNTQHKYPLHRTKQGFLEMRQNVYERVNKRSVWEIATAPFPQAHFATFPPALVDPCIKAGCRSGGTVLDPFAGAGTTGLVADRLQRNAILIELNANYAAMARRRIYEDAPLLTEIA